jgi:hypothetical protein
MFAFLRVSGLLLVGMLGLGQDLNIEVMRHGGVYAKSSIPDSLAPGGFGGSDNYPLTINESLAVAEQGLFLKIDTAEVLDIQGLCNGYKFYIVNKADTVIPFSASDSRLSVLAEVLVDGKWSPIEYLLSSGCGNSYHTVYLKPGEYWEFEVPKFTGVIQSKLRYRLELRYGVYLYSNEINTSFNKAQLTNKQSYNSQNLMDPYFED